MLPRLCVCLCKCVQVCASACVCVAPWRHQSKDGPSSVTSSFTEAPPLPSLSLSLSDSVLWRHQRTGCCRDEWYYFIWFQISFCLFLFFFPLWFWVRDFFRVLIFFLSFFFSISHFPSPPCGVCSRLGFSFCRCTALSVADGDCLKFFLLLLLLSIFFTFEFVGMELNTVVKRERERERKLKLKQINKNKMLRPDYGVIRKTNNPVRCYVKLSLYSPWPFNHLV